MSIQDDIHAKGFNMYNPKPANNAPQADFSRMKVGPKTLEDAVFDLSQLTKLNSRLATKENVQKAIETGNLSEMIEISNYFIKLSGIYRRLCKHMANFYRYDWMLTPYIKGKVDNNKVIDNFHK